MRKPVYADMNPALSLLLQRIGTKLLQIRVLRKEHIDDVAMLMEVSTTVLAQIEAGRHNELGIDLLSRLASYYQIPIEAILFPEEQRMGQSNETKTIIIEFLISENEYLRDRINSTGDAQG